MRCSRFGAVEFPHRIAGPVERTSRGLPAGTGREIRARANGFRGRLARPGTLGEVRAASGG
ncbi:hypothetical protein Kpho02_06780 [Kitasatospora phosalacinea]|uniref:Uncharacterized protein n=1 Tax=Kitasatospora phosalacinea TaxID=2065 RepID=A0A9W6Q4E7_9ACTN|nr:hypothetical protein Kpho02_06780 [Kitasatospora phosalacinea]